MLNNLDTYNPDEVTSFGEYPVSTSKSTIQPQNTSSTVVKEKEYNGIDTQLTPYFDIGAPSGDFQLSNKDIVQPNNTTGNVAEIQSEEYNSTINQFGDTYTNLDKNLDTKNIIDKNFIDSLFKDNMNQPYNNSYVLSNDEKAKVYEGSSTNTGNTSIINPSPIIDDINIIFNDSQETTTPKNNNEYNFVDSSKYNNSSISALQGSEQNETFNNPNYDSNLNNINQSTFNEYQASSNINPLDINISNNTNDIFEGYDNNHGKYEIPQIVDNYNKEYNYSEITPNISKSLYPIKANNMSIQEQGISLVPIINSNNSNFESQIIEQPSFSGDSSRMSVVPYVLHLSNISMPNDIYKQYRMKKAEKSGLHNSIPFETKIKKFKKQSKYHPKMYNAKPLNEY